MNDVVDNPPINAGPDIVPVDIEKVGIEQRIARIEETLNIT